ncbi:MAG: hypothetical protein KDC67_13030 [Ignavibacteriae bacterium]|nr:hypothetical protein [Ignavibacteriota bacterium]
MKENLTFTDYLSVLYKWQKFLIINLLIVGIIATTISFLIPKTYRATAAVILAPESSMGLGGLSGLISGGSTMSLGAKLFGMSSTDEDLILGLLNSRTIIEKVVNKFNLYEYYDEDEERNYDKLIKSMSGDLSFEPNEYGMVEISVVNKNPEQSAEIANYFVYLADSVNIELAIRNAKNNRIFVERRYQKNIDDLKSAEDSMYAFQKKYGIFAVPEQLEASVKAAAEIEGLLTQRELMLDMLKATSGESSPQYTNLLSEVTVLRKKVNELKYADKLSSTSNVLFPFKKAPDMIIEYYRLFREVEIQSKIMEFSLPIFEQAKLDEQKSIPTLLVVDKAVAPQLKYSPKKSVIILGSLFLLSFILIPLVFVSEKVIGLEKYDNIIQQKQSNFANRIIKLYKMKF